MQEFGHYLGPGAPAGGPVRPSPEVHSREHGARVKGGEAASRSERTLDAREYSRTLPTRWPTSPYFFTVFPRKLEIVNSALASAMAITRRHAALACAMAVAPMMVVSHGRDGHQLAGAGHHQSA